ncbi:very-long-chain (3R)-3-hydroxyacyl-CoA dehydratase-like protein [Leptotrombidium deliense]|uniref:Very-long-chain (3R)-3-hydroxyacyl-CoA dehydratase n=1 Tax=Leptotrombidium deliense TaxID=299467 RepID=A0A443S6H6_9ACAR|nr:very-long-chain (3R)-3-hydroxyacyl-CoA dehydratase-like protein [Leptotrombidium deliense]
MLAAASEGPESMKNIYSVIGAHLKSLFLLQFAEVFHTVIGLTKGSAVFPLIQSSVRAFVLFLLIDREPEIHYKWSTYYLLLVWSLVELFRYPYYITSILNVNIKFIKSLRYTVWIPLYPAGIFLEAVVCCQNIPLAEKSLKYSLSLPNPANFSFHFTTFLKLHVGLFIWIGAYFMLSHMYRQMIKALYTENPKKRS